MNTYDATPVEKTERIGKLVAHLYAKLPEIEAARAELITESYKQTEGQPVVMRRALAFAHILENIPIIIRPGELIVGSSTSTSDKLHIFEKAIFPNLVESTAR